MLLNGSVAISAGAASRDDEVAQVSHHRSRAGDPVPGPPRQVRQDVHIEHQHRRGGPGSATVDCWATLYGISGSAPAGCGEAGTPVSGASIAREGPVPGYQVRISAEPMGRALPD